jgi:hypothetical protein
MTDRKLTAENTEFEEDQKESFSVYFVTSVVKKIFKVFSEQSIIEEAKTGGINSETDTIDTSV